MNPLIGVAALACLVATGATAHAALPDCQPPEKAPFIVFLSEPEFSPQAFASRAEMLRFFNRLQDHLDQKRDREMAGLAGVPFRVARCEKRVPAIDGQDFTREVVRSLYTRNVVVEIWGALDAERKSGGRQSPRAQINYLLVPIRRAADAGTPGAPGLHRFHYPDGPIVATDFVDLVSNSDLHAFVATAIGTMEFDGDRFAEAHQMMCQAGPQLGRIQKRLAASPATQAQGESIGTLRAFVRALAGRAIREARKKPGAVQAFAQLHEPDNPCSSEEEP